MATLFELPTFLDERGKLTVIENQVNFDIKRVYYIYDVKSLRRGGHKHKITKQALICVSGSCRIYVKNKLNERDFSLDDPKICLLLEPEDWHYMDDFSAGTVLLVLASEKFDADDYIDEY